MNLDNDYDGFLQQAEHFNDYSNNSGFKEQSLNPKDQLKRLIKLREKKQAFFATFDEEPVEQTITEKIKNQDLIDLSGANPKIISQLQTIKHTLIQSEICQITKLKALTIADFYNNLWTHRKNPHNSIIHLDEICTICQFPLFDFQDQNIKTVEQITLQHREIPMDQVVSLECGHFYHLLCLEGGFKDYLQCPICCRIYGQKIGDQPDGEMFCQLDRYLHCDGYYNVGTIIIDYQMKGGIRNGVIFNGTRRVSYLPDTKDGRQILRLLKIAFERRLIFTVGRSITNGMDNQTVWNGIHHKTKVYGGSVNYGWPDETYFFRVRQELASKGIY